WNSTSVRVASCAENSTSSVYERARRTLERVAARTSSCDIRSIEDMWTSLVEMNTCSLADCASAITSHARSMSPSPARHRSAITAGEPRHHRAQSRTDLLDLVRPLARAERLEPREPGLRLGHPLGREGTASDLAEDPPHLLAGALVHDARPTRVVAVLGRLGD